jgi:hypothetical protein
MPGSEGIATSTDLTPVLEAVMGSPVAAEIAIGSLRRTGSTLTLSLGVRRPPRASAGRTCFTTTGPLAERVHLAMSLSGDSKYLPLSSPSR